MKRAIADRKDCLPERHKLEAWDSAAGYLIVEEAGGKVTDQLGNPFSVYQPKLLATNGHIHADMVAVINNKKQL